MKSAFGLSPMGTAEAGRAPRISLFSGGYDRDPNTVFLLKLDEGEGAVAVDYSDFHNDGSIESAQWDAGRYGYGLHFDGINDRIVIPHNPIFDLTEFCIEAWVWLEYGGSQRIIEKPGSYYLGLSQSGNQTRQVKLNAGIWSGNAIQQISTGWNYGIEGWLHVALQRNQAGYLSLVVGGIEDTVSSFVTGLPDATTNDLLIGCGSGGYFFQGVMDEVRVSNVYRAISGLDPNRG